jgi:predicted kinase
MSARASRAGRPCSPAVPTAGRPSAGRARLASVPAAPTLVLVTGAPAAGKSTLAEAIADQLRGCTVVGWDWVMGALAQYPAVQAAVRGLNRQEYRRLGWSLMWSVAEEQLRYGRSVVLDGVARETEIGATRALASRIPPTRCLVVALECSNDERARARIEGRRRDIPGWHELSWEDVDRSRRGWATPESADRVIDTSGDPDPDELARALFR